MTEYNAKSIQVLEGLDGVRQNLNVYLSALDSEGIFLSFREPIVNAFDEFDDGHGKQVFVAVDASGYWVSDEARGIPVENHPVSKKSTLTTVLTTLSAGGKMKKEGSGYSKATAGVHGMGVSITNACSSEMQVWTYRGGWYTQSFKKGKETTPVQKTKAPQIPGVTDAIKKGTTVRFKPDTSCFDPGSKLELSRLKEFLDLSSYLHPKLKIRLVISGKETTYFQPNGLSAFLQKRIETSALTPLSKVLLVTGAGVSLALQWMNSDVEDANSFVNGSPTSDGGTHVTGLTKAISEALAPYAGKRSKYRPEDLRAGLTYFLNAEVLTPRFTTQTKEKLRTPEANALVYEATKDQIKEFFDKNKGVAREIIKRANDFAKVSEDAEARKKSVAGLAAKGKRKNLPAKLSTSTTKIDAERWVYTVEGDSAASEAVKARDSHFQEILRMRGKILNVYTAKNDAKIYANEEVKSFLQAVGYDPTLPKEQEQKYRCGRVIIMADEDVDGNHISVLVLLLILKKLPDMIDKGMVYILLGSLYTGVDRKNKRYYADTLEELQKKAGAGLVATSITRMKGWGEAQKEWLVDLAFGSTAKLMKVLPSSKEDIENFIQLVSDGDDAVAKRFALLSRSSVKNPTLTARRPLRNGPIRVQGSKKVRMSFRFSARYRQA